MRPLTTRSWYKIKKLRLHHSGFNRRHPAGSEQNISGEEDGIIDNTLPLVLLSFFFFFLVFKSNHVSSLKYNGNMLKSRFKYDLTKDNSQL